MGVSLTPLATSMLALLCERPMHCYEMYRTMLDRREDHNVKVRPGSLYHTMDRMQAGGLVVATGTDRDGGRPERTTFAITEPGRAALKGWIRETLEWPVNEYPRLPVALSEARNLPRAELVELLRARHGHLSAQLEEWRHDVDQAYAAGVPEAHLIDADYAFEITRAELEWLSRLVDRLESKELEWPSEARL